MTKMYTVVFNSESPQWSDNIRYNEHCVRHYIARYNGLLMTRGYVFLRDILETLGIPITKESVTGGWVYRLDNEVKVVHRFTDDTPDIELTFTFEDDIRDHF